MARKILNITNIQTILTYTPQMKGRWESNINVWFPFMYSQKWNCYFQNSIIMFCLSVPTLIYLWEIYIFPGLVCLFCCRKVCGPTWEDINSSQTHECGNCDWGCAIPRKGIHKSDFRCSVLVQYIVFTRSYIITQMEAHDLSKNCTSIFKNNMIHNEL